MVVRVAAVLALLAGVASAQPAPDGPAEPTAGSKLFEEGRELAKQNKFAEACAKFEQSYALDNGVGTELNLADCHEHLGHFARAFRLFDEASTRSTDNAGRAKFARERADTLAKKLATAVINLPDPDATGLSVTIAGRAVKASGVITEKVDPGSVAVHVATPSKVIYDDNKMAAAGATVIFDVKATDAPVDDGGEVNPRHKRLVVAYTVGGIGLATLATSVVIGLIANSRYGDDSARCPKDALTGKPQCTDMASFDAVTSDGNLADVGTYVGVAGVAAIAAGAIIYFTAPKDLVVAPMATNQTAGLAISGRF